MRVREAFLFDETQFWFDVIDVSFRRHRGEALVALATPSGPILAGAGQRGGSWLHRTVIPDNLNGLKYSTVCE